MIVEKQSLPNVIASNLTNEDIIAAIWHSNMTQIISKKINTYTTGLSINILFIRQKSPHITIFIEIKSWLFSFADIGYKRVMAKITDFELNTIYNDFQVNDNLISLNFSTL